MDNMKVFGANTDNYKKVEHTNYYYIARIYKGNSVATEEIALSINDLHERCKSYIEDPSVSEIAIVRVEDIGYFKLPNYLDDSSQLLVVK